MTTLSSVTGSAGVGAVCAERRQADRNQGSESADPRLDFSMRHVLPFRPQQTNPRCVFLSVIPQHAVRGFKLSSAKPQSRRPNLLSDPRSTAILCRAVASDGHRRD